MKFKSITTLVILTFCGNLFSQAIVLSGNSSGATLQRALATTVNTDGVLDQTFGNALNSGGTNFIAPSIAGGTQDWCYAIGVQQDGKIVMGGYSTGADTQKYFALARYLPDGQLDVTFGATAQGAVSNIPGTVYISQHIADGATNDLIFGLIIQPDGKIVVGGTSEHNLALARFLPNGTLDSSFGVNEGGTTSLIQGTCYIPVITIYTSVYPPVVSLALQSDGKIIAGATTDSQFMVARFLQNGALDTSFGQNVTAPTASSIPGTVYINGTIAGGGNDTLSAIVLQSDDSIVVGGYSEDNSGHSHFSVARFLSNGFLDSYFGQNVPESTTSNISGTVYITNFISGGGNRDEINGIALQPDGKIIVVGLSFTSGARFALARFLPNGALDASFGQSVPGSTETIIPGTVYVSFNVGYPGDVNRLNAVSLQADGKIVGTGQADIWDGAGGRGHFVATRFLPSGILDTTFGGNGVDTTSTLPGTVYVPNSICGAAPGGTTDYVYAAAIQENGAIVAGGITRDDDTGYGYFGIARFANLDNLASYQAAYESVGAGVLA